MITPIFLLCILTRQALCLTKDISPAKIFAPLKTISEGSSLYITCSTFGSKRQSTVYVYLCKDGVGIDTAMQKKEQNDAHFAIRQVSRHDSGHYSCIYSRTKYKPSALNDTGSSRIQIQVIPSFLPADLSVAGPSTVSEGNHVELRCTLSKTVQTLGECQLVQSYLTRNDTVVQVQRFNITQMEATFIIEGAVVKDSGGYSCMVLPLKCFEMNKGALYGNNSVLVEVKASLVIQLMFYSGIISPMLSLGLCLWMIRHRCGSSKVHSRHNQVSDCGESQQPHMHMLGEEQEQTKREDVESPDSGSFSVEEEDSFQSDDSSYYNGIVYSGR